MSTFDMPYAPHVGDNVRMIGSGKRGVITRVYGNVIPSTRTVDIKLDFETESRYYHVHNYGVTWEYAEPSSFKLAVEAGMRVAMANVYAHPKLYMEELVKVILEAAKDERI